ncbi:MAG: bifunctional 3-deoxy-7-phosphoheptulonate synthase/chorismate mutase type II [Bacteroidales bacterium]|nr:bifunctional 3-deoxy-7-phosphoheptulonate synthase/chorismate mutase type II [Bacteroidales bacterium]
MKPIIAGPCSAESEGQIWKAAEFLATKTSVKTLRAGVWKLRTRPGGFEGYGENALRWLQSAKEKFGLSTAVEITTPEHVELCLKYNIDTVWIGARTTGNPLLVQKIADALAGCNLSVMVKNPLNPDWALWLGAIERVEEAGIPSVIAVHRGFGTAQHSEFRNLPMWEIPIEIKRRRPDLQIYCDPSHIAGRADLVFPVAQRALDMTMDGLMIEIHPDPKHALTDAFQQLNFSEFKNLVSQLVEKDTHGKHNELEQMRAIIDDLDEELIATLAKRMKIVEKIGEYKHEHNVSTLQMERWKKLLENRLNFGSKHNLNEEFLVALLNVIHAESLRIQANSEQQLKN